MNDPNWSDRAFLPLVARLRALGVQAIPPHSGQSPDAYVAQLMGYILDAQGKAIDPAFVDPMFQPARALPSEIIETPRAHVVEKSGRSFRIEGAIQDGEFYRPGQPLPPIKHEGGQ